MNSDNTSLKLDYILLSICVAISLIVALFFSDFTFPILGVHITIPFLGKITVLDTIILFILFIALVYLAVGISMIRSKFKS